MGANQEAIGHFEVALVLTGDHAVPEGRGIFAPRFRKLVGPVLARQDAGAIEESASPDEVPNAD
jgi:hypothetical protein